jgi:hypothetical protein
MFRGKILRMNFRELGSLLVEPIPKYLKLHEQLRESVAHFAHELLHKFCHFSVCDALTTQSEVKWISEILGIVRPEVQAYWNCGLRTDSGIYIIINLRM